ncbi:MAG: hypothetical protein AMJ79_01450 [Phycisphaerae bacterium SM23_30]|nr:MAG: hypothetical protein AMJ79_01450 [Phycisphaerae bacterium SM23_30]
MNKKKLIKKTWQIVVASFGVVWLTSGCDYPLSSKNLEGIKVPAQRVDRIEALALPPAPEPVKPYDPNAILRPKAPAAEEISLTIEQCRAMALENNLDLKVQMFNPRLSEEGIAEARALFEPLALTNIYFSKTDSPILSRAMDASQSESLSANFQVQIPLRTGGQITLRHPFYRSETDQEFSLLATSYMTDFSVAVNQPLLRGGGISANEYSLRVAHYGSETTKARTKLQVISVLADVDRVYWRLYAARRELEVRKQEYDLAVELSESARRKLKVGQAAEIDVVRADNAAAQSLESIILAQNQVRDRERYLKQILNETGLDIETPTILFSATQPNPLRYQIDTSRLVDYALQNRMELLELELQLLQDADSIDYFKNAALPLVSLSYTYNINGLGAELDDSYDLVWRNRFVDHTLGLTVQVPLGNKAAEARLRQAQLQRLQRLASKERREAMIKKEVLDAVDQMEANWQRVAASRQSVILALRTLQAEQRLFDLGRSISYDLLNAQAGYANARSAEIRALTEYQISQVDLAYATGALLTATRVEWETEFESLDIEK